MSVQTKKPFTTHVSFASEVATDRQRVSSPGDSFSILSSELMRRGDYRQAADLLENCGPDFKLRDRLGVCLMRLGAVDEAVRIYRQLVLMPGSVQERPGIDSRYKRNFATALLMKGLPSGALAVLAETGQTEHAGERRIRESIRRWEGSLSFFRWLDWRLNGIEPPHCNVPIDFQPGEFDDDSLKHQPGRPIAA